jgi:phospholipid transport system transporter-binding protein
MSDLTAWRVEGHSLILSGELTAKTLLPLWQQKDKLLNAVSSIDAQALTHVDSAGLALIVQFISEAGKLGRLLKITGVTENLNTLITLYNLKDIMADSMSA